MRFQSIMSFCLLKTNSFVTMTPFMIMLPCMSPRPTLFYLLFLVFFVCAFPSHLNEELFDSLPQLLIATFPSFPFSIRGDFNLSKFSCQQSSSLHSLHSLLFPSFSDTWSYQGFNTTNNSVQTVLLISSSSTCLSVSLPYFLLYHRISKTVLHIQHLQSKQRCVSLSPKLRENQLRKANYKALCLSLASVNQDPIVAVSLPTTIYNTLLNLLPIRTLLPTGTLSSNLIRYRNP